MATFADKVLVKQVATVSEYDAFRSWVSGNNLYQPAVVANTNAAAYLLGAERLFENAPKVEFEEMEVGNDGESGGLGTSRPTMTVIVVVKDGEETVKCVAEKEATMFEATRDLGDWNGAAKLEPEVSIEATDDPAVMRFKVARRRNGGAGIPPHSQIAAIYRPRAVSSSRKLARQTFYLIFAT